MSPQGQGPILIAGQTASGKSSLALKLAQALDGAVVNADSMQVFADLQILTARPSLDEMEGVPHYMYGHVAADTPYSVGDWLRDIEQVLDRLQAQQRPAIIVGGTGLYFKALLEGLSPVPQIDAAIRQKWRQKAEEIPELLHALLADRDPRLAARLHPSDRQRIVRGLEVLESTGKSLLVWQQTPGRSLLEQPPRARLVLSLPRDELYARCNQRFELMLQNGALDEVRHLLQMNLSDSLPIMRALGVRPMTSFLSGEMPLEEAINRGQTETRQYAKRQMSWLRRNMISWKWTSAQDMKCEDCDILSLM